MEYTTLGSTGTKVSRIGLGCMSFGGDRAWTLDREGSREVIERAIELGVNFFDTANVYGNGDSEAILGDVLADYDRDWPVVATKVYGDMDPDNPNASGLSRKAIDQELEASLDRLGMDTVDLYQIHRWDDETPIRETLSALDDAVRRGQVRYLGASSMWAHQLARALYTSEREGFERFVSMQNHYNLVYREEEREMLPFCEEEGLAVTPWSPLARGYLTRPHAAFDATTRGETEADTRDDRHGIYREGGGDEINDRVAEIAAEKGVTMAQIALAWQLHRDPVTAPIVGVSSVEHLEDAVEALDVSLTASEMEYLQEPYEPKPVVGHS